MLPGPVTSFRRLSLHDVELDSMEKGVVADRPGVGGPASKRLAIDLA